jgi:TPR repeat protein
MRAQFYLGDLYEQGVGVAQDDVEALKWFRLAAEQDDADAQYHLGRMYEEGRGGVEQDYVEAGQWYRLSAEKRNLGCVTYHGREDGAKAACCALGSMYEQGNGVAQLDSEAAWWYRNAAELGYAEAQFRLGLMFLEGRGVAPEYAEVEGFYKTIRVMVSLWRKGKPTMHIQDNAEVLKWLRLAAEQDHAGAQYRLGEMYLEGRGVKQDKAEAIRWFKLATANGHPVDLPWLKEELRENRKPK